MNDSPSGTDRFTTAWHLVLVIAVSAGYESLFLHHGINRLDESWPLYAGMQLTAGGTLYDDVLWVFPPGHVWIGWLANRIDPPGFVFARTIYAAFCVALSAAIYLLARRITEPAFALLAALLVAVAAPRSHLYQLLFGYRYLVLCVVALLAFDRRLRGGGPRWMFAAGLLVGVAVVMRLTPAFSVSCGIALATIAADPRPRAWLRDLTHFGVGVLVPVAPVLLWLATTVGLPTVWHEVVLHPLGMLQALPPPEIVAPSWSDRESIFEWFVAVQFRLHWVLYGGTLVVLAGLWVRARLRGAAFDSALWLAIAVFGAVFFIRSLGRSDEPHLDSVIVPVCLLFAALLGSAFEQIWPAGQAGKSAAQAVVCLAALASWIFLLGTDLYWSEDRRGTNPVYSTRENIAVSHADKAEALDHAVALLDGATRPGDRILAVGPTPIFYVLSGRRGPGYADIIMPGTFLSDADEVRFLERLKADPPAAAVWSARYFDDTPEGSIAKTAKRVVEWVDRHYRRLGPEARWIVMVRRGHRPTAP